MTHQYHNVTKANYMHAIRATGMPQAMQILLHEIPRDSWQTHPGFKQRTRNWLGAHQMFQRLATIITNDIENYLNNLIDDNQLMSHISYYGGKLVNNLHGHHHFEDTSYFPELCAADPRFADGIKILETDHKILDFALQDFTEQANQLINQFTTHVSVSQKMVSQIHLTSTTIKRLLKRHLADEEDLAVPIILHYRLRG